MILLSKYNSVINSIQSDLNSLDNFHQKMKMRIPKNKCKVLKLNDGHIDKDYVFYLSGNKITDAHVARNLRHIDCKL